LPLKPAGGTPATLQELEMVTRLIQLALSARPQLQERRYHLPEASNLVMRSFYPLMGAFMADTHIAKLKVCLLFSPQSPCM